MLEFERGHRGIKTAILSFEGNDLRLHYVFYRVSVNKQ
jgi:hypothetical protein